MLDRITGMQVFARVVAQGSFSGAARSLGLSQTMVTKHIATLEGRLGVSLFHRSTRRLSLTEPGRLLLVRCQKILSDFEDMEQEVSAENQEARGLLRMNAPVSFAIRHVGPIMSEFSRRHPLVTVELGLDDRRIDPITEGWDLTLRIGRMPSSALRSRRLARIDFVVCASPSYLEERGLPLTIADLQTHHCLGYTLGEDVSTGRWSFGANGERTVPVNGPMHANNGDVLREAAVAGQGIIYQPTFIVWDELKSGRLVALSLDAPTITGPELHAVYAPTPHVPLKIRVMIDFLVAQYGPVPPWEI
ncbi:LysR family transcriptional regulator [Gluconobacter kanchanaburiensis]|uniref:Transcriptional regulator n=1 Tax=Gluconobacter kanchanaburiensis NBRC 103587 TaxID=1307948 RepID=A0A511B8X6_9PROT|nr:LysR family transcriptional regulator [Gluconobacter kanchanaburiensis]MBF0862609.1 LysR family transcriptional regulator [Gluconobacter kanchanaburiensis]GBR71932.1 LysR family transcriptional regulator [Gluconobacter kanchanaburiensis NBRC 103587]GEK96896.1 transcriptional regulator [Gluconobacter kanchanaburiensis NBRC 103587]